MGWDRGVDFISMYNLLLRNLNSKNTRETCYSIILLIQLRNGLRISESIESFKEYLLTRRREIYVKVRKKKNNDERLVVIPNEVEKHIDKCIEMLNIDNRKLRERVRTWFYEKYKLNTHSLRYSFITFLLKQNIPATIVSKITHHSNLNLILKYTQQKTADEILRNIF